jgi:hypothetical protein
MRRKDRFTVKSQGRDYAFEMLARDQNQPLSGHPARSGGHALGAPRVAYALPCYDQCEVYFTDATYTQQVGSHLKSCWGLWYWQGTQTEFKTTENVCCNNEPCWETGECVPDYSCSHDPCPPTPPVCPLRP